MRDDHQMRPAILFATPIAFSLLFGTVACRQAADPTLAMVVDSMHTVNNGALLTLQELDGTRFEHLDSIFEQQQAQFLVRLKDTLRPAEADRLANHFLVLRDASRMGRDQRALVGRLRERNDRLAALKQDIAQGTTSRQELEQAVLVERTLLDFDHAQVLAVIENYRTAQHAWELRDTVAILLAETPRKADRP